jgi:hypothetical protein
VRADRERIGVHVRVRVDEVEARQRAAHAST